MIRNYFSIDPEVILEEAFEGVLHIYDRARGEMWTSAKCLSCKFGEMDVKIYHNPEANPNEDRGMYFARIPILDSYLQFSRWTPQSFAKALDTVLGRLYNNQLELDGEGFWVEGAGDLEFVSVHQSIENAMRGSGSAAEIGRSVHAMLEEFVGNPINSNTLFQIRNRLGDQMRRAGVAMGETAAAMSEMSETISRLGGLAPLGTDSVRNPCGEIGLEEGIFRSLGVPPELLENDDNYSSS